jgi:hypothetical protein
MLSPRLSYTYLVYAIGKEKRTFFFMPGLRACAFDEFSNDQGVVREIEEVETCELLPSLRIHPELESLEQGVSTFLGEVETCAVVICAYNYSHLDTRIFSGN